MTRQAGGASRLSDFDTEMSLFQIRVKVQAVEWFESKIKCLGASRNSIVKCLHKCWWKRNVVSGLMPTGKNWICGRLANTSCATFQLMYHIPPIYPMQAIMDGFQSQIKAACFPILNNSESVSRGSAGCTQSRYKPAAKIFWAPVKINPGQ